MLALGGELLIRRGVVVLLRRVGRNGRLWTALLLLSSDLLYCGGCRRVRDFIIHMDGLYRYRSFL